jgi:16S rRNA (guanine966-N2)-methyltransferase
VDGTSVLDLYAGSGALGLEALSRGAGAAVFVDSSRDACRTIGANLETLGLRATVHCQDVLRFLATDRGPYDLILADPPYTFTSYERLAPHFHRLLAEDGLAVLQTPAVQEPSLEGLKIRTTRRYSSARLTLFEP